MSDDGPTWHLGDQRDVDAQGGPRGDAEPLLRPGGLDLPPGVDPRAIERPIVTSNPKGMFQVVGPRRGHGRRLLVLLALLVAAAAAAWWWRR